MIYWRLIVFFLWLGAGTAAAVEAKYDSLDGLLDAVRQQSASERALNKQREAQFLANRDSQAKLLRGAREALQQEQRRSDALKTTFDANEAKLTESEDLLHQRVGSLGELFGVVRQVAGDTAGILEQSLVSAQIPDRALQVREIASSKALPSMQKLEVLWFALQQEMTESGKVVQYNGRMVGADGKDSDAQITRVGVFNAVSEGNYLRYLPETSQLVELPRQPASRFGKMAGAFAEASGEFAPMAIDPSRGAILALYVQTPDLVERIAQGKLVGYIIIAMAVIGVLMVVVRAISLSGVERKIKRQLGSDTPDASNPLGRIMSVYFNNKAIDTETLERKIDEAILKEAPALERGLATIKILAVIAPLLGLLGTVTGMIETFQSITLFGTGDPKLMAGGISQALVTTVLGLVAAIPLILLHSVASNKSKRCINILEEQSAGIIAVHAEQARA